LGVSDSCNPKGLSRSVLGFYYMLYSVHDV
jgi:hypothetical protein